jgi:putative Mg2+ transporter-C (MgtC) family protein
MFDLGDPTLLAFGKLALAALLGIALGTERAIFARQNAGSRTFGLVALGACLFVLAGVNATTPLVGVVNFDPARTLASIVQGIGFLGAGLIIFQGNSLHGVTTAAGLWVTAAIGALVAFEEIAIAVFATCLVMAIFLIMWYIEHALIRKYQTLQDQSGELNQ